MPTRRSRSAERKNTLIFLHILKNFYPRIVDSSDKLPIWDQVLKECQKRGIFLDKTPVYLAQKRWPASVGIVKKASKKRGPLSEKDQLIVEIERYRTPDFCYGKIQGDRDNHDDDDDDSTNDESNNVHTDESINNVDDTINGGNYDGQENATVGNENVIRAAAANDMNNNNRRMLF
uniref:Uncharacterized protein n=1 Tax=Panagrolaimus sp. ES5 TaxID=591445 RepID=A0AC34G883_9BILA